MCDRLHGIHLADNQSFTDGRVQQSPYKLSLNIVQASVLLEPPQSKHVCDISYVLVISKSALMNTITITINVSGYVSLVLTCPYSGPVLSQQMTSQSGLSVQTTPAMSSSGTGEFSTVAKSVQTHLIFRHSMSPTWSLAHDKLHSLVTGLHRLAAE